MTSTTRILLAFCVLALASIVAAQDSSDSDILSKFLLDRQKVEKLFQEVAEPASRATFTVRSGSGSRRILATCVRKDGHFLTKESEIVAESLRVIDDQDREWPAVIVASDTSLDIALIRTSGATPEFPVIAFHESELRAGQWVALPKDSLGRLRSGVLSVEARRFGLPPSKGAFLGVNFEDAIPGARIVRIYPDTAADRHGLTAGDVVTTIDGQSVQDTESLVGEIREREPESVIKLKVLRGTDTIDVDVQLGRRPLEEANASQQARRQRAQPEVSTRASGFPSAFQHDINMQPHHAGSPVIDRLGRVVGLNIARSSRTAAVAIPSDRVNVFLREHLK
ncbi:MAG TPA: PDZ domain-containing protein [Planctomycetota bacterium]|nr:PDZ domain-containing protein [Planctomycetota bacterium]